VSAAIRSLGLAIAPALFTALLVTTGCGGDRQIPPAAPSVAAPVDAIPPDLDWVVRLDVGRIHAALGKSVVKSLREKTPGTPHDEAAHFVTDAFERARVVVVATRYEGGAFQDFVVALDGDFAGLDPRRYTAEPPWQPPIDLGGDVRRWDRIKPKARSDVARLYARSDHLLVAVTEAEIDSVEAVIERGAPANPLKPRERGFLSAAVRMRSLMASQGLPLIGTAFRGARGAEGFFDTDGDGFRAEITCELATEADAKQAAELLTAARAVLEAGGGRFASLARHTSIEAQGAVVIARAELVRDVLGDLVGEVLR